MLLSCLHPRKGYVDSVDVSKENPNACTHGLTGSVSLPVIKGEGHELSGCGVSHPISGQCIHQHCQILLHSDSLIVSSFLKPMNTHKPFSSFCHPEERPGNQIKNYFPNLLS